MKFLSNKFCSLAVWDSNGGCLYFFVGGGIRLDEEMFSLECLFLE
jgi:hypothetical protein